jgi:hypothetical protein
VPTAPTDPLDLVDPVRLVILLLPEAWRAPIGALLSLIVATQLLAAMIVARLPLSARAHPRWGRAVRALHWYAVVRLRNELGTLKLPGADVAPRVAVVPLRADELALGARLPEPIEPAPRRRPGEGGYARFGAMLTVITTGALVMIILAFALAAGTQGCGPTRELAMRATTGVPDPTDCQPLAQRCAETPGGVVPVVCSPVEVPGSNRRREWPMLPRTADGRQRVCAHGCLVTGGLAHCAPAVADGGVQ